MDNTTTSGNQMELFESVSSKKRQIKKVRLWSPATRFQNKPRNVLTLVSKVFFTGDSNSYSIQSQSVTGKGKALKGIHGASMRKNQMKVV